MQQDHSGRDGSQRQGALGSSQGDAGAARAHPVRTPSIPRDSANTGQTTDRETDPPGQRGRIGGSPGAGPTEERGAGAASVSEDGRRDRTDLGGADARVSPSTPPGSNG